MSIMSIASFASTCGHMTKFWPTNADKRNVSNFYIFYYFIKKLLALHPLYLFLQAGSDPVGQISLITTNDKS